MSRKSMIKPYKHCKKCGALIVSGELCEDCKPITNADRIRQMTDEELASWIKERYVCDRIEHGCPPKLRCYDCKLNFMKAGVSEDAGSKTD